MDERKFCCAACRLLQVAGTECIECGSSIADVEASSELLRYRLPSDVTRRKQGIRSALAGVGVATAASVAGLVFMGPVGWAALPVIAYGAMVGTGAITSIRDRKYRSIVAIGIPDPAIGEGAVERAGVARPLTGPITSRIDDAPILVEHVVIRTRSSILLRSVRATPFVLEAELDAVVVSGEVRLETRPTTTKLRAHDPLFARLGIPAGLLPGKIVVDVRTLRPGDSIVARGVLEDATLQELAFHREGGQAHTMQGRRGSLVVLRAS
jgi:hypothetical protein